MRLSWVIAGALLALTWLLASMQLDFLAVASFTLLIMTAMAGYYKPEALSYAGGPLQAHSPKDPKEQPPTYSPHGHAHESPKQKHFHEADADEKHHSEKKDSEDSHHSRQTKHAGREKARSDGSEEQARSHEEHGGEEQLE